MAILPFSPTEYNMPYSIPPIVQEFIRRESAEEKANQTLPNKDQWRAPSSQEDVPSNMTSLNAKVLSPDQQSPLTGELKSVGSSKQYRKILLSQHLSEVLSFLDQLAEVSPSSSKSLALLVKIRGILDLAWNNIEPGDRNIALFITTLEELFNKDYWKNFEKEDIRKIQEAIFTFTDTKQEPTTDEIMNLIPHGKVKLLPEMQQDE